LSGLLGKEATAPGPRKWPDVSSAIKDLISGGPAPFVDAGGRRRSLGPRRDAISAW